MDLSKYFSSAPTDLQLVGKELDLQLLKVYAFNAYFNADPLCTEQVNDGTTYRRDNYAGIDGVFINETLEENTIECLYSYYVGDGAFTLTRVFNLLNSISAEIDDVRKGLNIKYICFYSIASLLLIFFWYYISSFGAVYQNTQIYLIKNTLISYGFCFIYPFFINIFPSVFRIISLKKKDNGDRECIYKISNILQLL